MHISDIFDVLYYLDFSENFDMPWTNLKFSENLISYSSKANIQNSMIFTIYRIQNVPTNVHCQKTLNILTIPYNRKKNILGFFIKNTCIISCNVYNIVRLNLLYEKEMFL